MSRGFRDDDRDEYNRHQAEDDEPVHFTDSMCTRETAMACLCIIDGKSVWIPKSQIHDDSEVYKMGTSGRLIVTGWIAKEKGLV